MGQISDRLRVLVGRWDAARLVLGALATVVAMSAILAGRFDVAMEPGVRAYGAPALLDLSPPEALPR